MARFLRDLADKPYEAGVCDCWLSVADWVKLCCGKDPAAHWRGAYTSYPEAEAMIRSAGGMLGLRGVVHMSGVLAPVKPQEARAGDIGQAEFNGVKIGAICTGPNAWAAKTEAPGVIMWNAIADFAYRITG